MLGLGNLLLHLNQSAEALYWIRQAAERGDADAMTGLGLEYQAIGKADEAEIWYRRAAELDNAIAMANLGHMFKKRGDKVEAEHWNRMGATLGQPGAMSNLAHLLQDRGELDEAMEWFRKAADRAMSSVDEHPSYYVPWPGECYDLGVSNAVLSLAEALIEQEKLPKLSFGSEESQSLVTLEQPPRWRNFTKIAVRHRKLRNGGSGPLNWPMII